jgi:hypothetical protein
MFKTESANILSHIFTVIDIAITTQTRAMPIIHGDQYVGTALIGYGYTLSVMKQSYGPGSNQELRDAITMSDSHTRSLLEIMKKISFQTENDRERAFSECRRMWDVKALLDALPLVGGSTTQDYVKDRAKRLNFVADKELVINATNIEKVIQYITNPSADLAELPYLHHSLLFSSVRRDIAWSAFGHNAPSFRVPAGRTMRLDQPFQVSVRTSGPTTSVTTRVVKSIAVAVVPLDLALRHLKEVIEKKEILNPFGNAQVRVSDSNLNKIFRDDSCNKIVDGLKKLTGSVVSGPGGTKRKDLEGEDEIRKKRARYEF